MSSIEYLSIQGIRSFSHQTRQTIKFFKPLTMIVGQNGCGKTTIIECLNASTSGSMPPGTNRGRSFVHDPRLEGISNIKGQIRFQFQNMSKQVLVVRSYEMKVKDKKGKMEFKQLDSSVQTKGKDGDLKSVSHKCTDVDLLIPKLLGVSKSILESVVFCHQTEITWPLQESGVLKKRFDEIFASSRYSKALQNMKSVQKDIQQKMKKYQVSIASLKERCEEYQNLETNKKQVEMKVDKIESKMTSLKEGIEIKEKEIQKYEGVNKKISKIKKEIMKLTGEYTNMKKIVSELKVDVEKSQLKNESDDRLNNSLKDFQNQLNKIANERDSLRDSITGLENTLAKITKENQNLETKLGILKEGKRVNEKRIYEVSQLINEMAPDMKLEGKWKEEEEYDLEKIEKFVEILNEKIRDMKKIAKEKRRKMVEKENDLNLEISNTQSKIQSIKKEVDRNIKKIDESRRKRDKEKKNLDDLDVQEEDLEECENKVGELSLQLKNLKQKININEISSEIEKKNSELKEKNKLIRELKKQLKIREREKVTASKIIDIEKEMEEIKLEIEDKKKKFLKLFSNFYEEEGLSESSLFSVVLKRSEKKLKDLLGKKENNRTLLEKKNTEISNKTVRINLKKKEGKKIEKEMKKLETQIKSTLPQEFLNNKKDNSEEESEILEQSEVENYIETISKKEKNYVDQLAFNKAMKKTYSTFLNHAKENSECYVCEREFETDQENEEYIKKTEDMIEKVPGMILKLEGKIEDMQGILTKCTKIVPKVERLEKVKTDFLKVQKEVENLSEDKKKEEKELSDLKKNLKLVKKKVEEYEKIKEISKEISALEKSVKEKVKKMNDLREEIASFAGKENLTYENLSKRCSLLENEHNDLSETVEKLRESFSVGSKEISKLTKEVNGKKEELNEMKLSIQKIDNLKEKINGYNNTMKNRNEENAKIKKEIPDLKEKITVLKKSLNELREKHGKKGEEHQKVISNVHSCILKITNYSKQIRTYRLSGKEEQIETTEMSIEKKKVRISTIKKKIKEEEIELRNKEKIISQKNAIDHDIKVNVSFREKRNKTLQLENKIKLLQEKKEELQKSTNEDEDNDEVETYSEKKKLYQKLLQQLSRYQGELSSHNSSLKDLTKRLKSKRFKNIHEKHRVTLIKFKTCQASIKDFDLYHQALSTALMRFHDLKIQEINQSIKELWQKTYRGNDIDCIKIKAEKQKSTGKRGNTGHNYRVVMIKGDIELDLRGRCSAGQRILACLIIRLALADSFCVNFGVLTLDEPVQNLDSQNMVSFAESLKSLIKERRKNKNFQLVVITHNEDFAKRIGSNEYVDYYYRIRKNETGHSLIEKKEFRERIL